MTQEKKIDPMKKIREIGILRAQEWWATHHLPYKEFNKAKDQYYWEEDQMMQKKQREEAEMQINKLYPWQKYVYNIFKEIPDTRTIYVVLDKDGGKGKTFFQHMLLDLHPDEVVDITNKDLNDAILFIKKNKGRTKMIQLNLTRQTAEKVNLSAIEFIKEGISIKPPHLFIYTNEEIDWDCLTEDKWQIIYLKKTYNDGFIVFPLSQWIWCHGDIEHNHKTCKYV